MSKHADSGDYTWQTPEDEPLPYIYVNGRAVYDTRTCAERHGEQLAELGRRIIALEKLISHCMSSDLIAALIKEDRELIEAQGATIAELKAALMRLSEQVLEQARTIEQWRGEL